nr:hypothetical protein CFP56_57618 [Quercus suber]
MIETHLKFVGSNALGSESDVDICLLVICVMKMTFFASCEYIGDTTVTVSQYHHLMINDPTSLLRDAATLPKAVIAVSSIKPYIPPLLHLVRKGEVCDGLQDALDQLDSS